MTATRLVATCSNCDDQHPLGDRPLLHGDSDKETTTTTKCPQCGYPTYRSDVVEKEDVKSDAARIADVVDVKGVGEQTRENIVAHFLSWHGFVEADLEELTTIDGVGQQNGQRIIDNRPDNHE